MHENFSPPWFTDADLFGSGFLNTVESLLSEGLIVAIQNDKSPTNVSISSFSASGTLHRLRKAPMPSLLTFNLRPIDPIVFKVVTTEGREIDSMGTVY